MQETEFYQQILGLKQPWFVAEVKLDTESQQVDIFVQHPEGTSFGCPECGKLCSVYDHTGSRQWRHLDTMQFRTVLHAKPPRVKCEEHGVKQVNFGTTTMSDRQRITSRPGTRV
jgi:transposase